MKHDFLKQLGWMLLATAVLAGCGVVDTAASGAANAKAAADEAREGKKTEERVQQEVDAAMAKDAAQKQALDDKDTAAGQ